MLILESENFYKPEEKPVTEEMILSYSRSTVKELFKEAIIDVDLVAGPGSADANPELVSAMVQARAADINCMMLSQAIQKASWAISTSLDDIYKEVSRLE